MKGCETRQDERITEVGRPLGPQNHLRHTADCKDRCGCVHQSHGRGRRRWLADICIAKALLFAFLLLVASTNALSPSELGPAKESGVCSSQDIRSYPQAFKALVGCRVIEGSLQILLFDNYNESAYEKLSFPELREITGYLMMYRVNGLRTLAGLFPNLSVIRGHKLFNNYAFILYEMLHMEEIGLHSLSDISRGSIRIEKNYMMCYVNTVDWDLIVANGKEGNYIKDNKPENECPVCPGDVSTSGGSPKVLGPAVCPLAPLHSKDTPRKEKHLCWNMDHCQKVCKPECKGSACTANGDCCDQSCLSGCSGPLFNNCTVCRDLSFGHLDNRKCIKDCPPNTFKHQEWRCITESECRNISKPREFQNQEDILKKPYKPINGVCMLDCPPNYSEHVVDNMAFCEKCEGTCKRECYGSNVDSIQAAEQLRGCTFIKGSLGISVRGGGNIVKELEEGLGLITDIQGSLKIAHSYPLVSLNFLKSLRTIHGIDYTNDKHIETALSVTDNQNLQDLWDWKQHGPINILNGKLFFHFNPKLCLDKIEPLRNMTRETNFTDLEVAKNSNGDKVACNVTFLNVTVLNRTPMGILISWVGFIHDDARSLLGYVVYFIEAPFRNVSLYEGRDACGGDGWQVDDVQVSPKDTDVFHILTRLKPYTQYAVYVKTYTIATERLGAQSPIIYVQTLPGQPSAPRIREVISHTPNSIELHWDPPDQPHGNITQYRIAVKWEMDKADFLMQRNYCSEPLVSESNVDKKPQVEVEESPKEKEIKENAKCQCDSNGFRNDDEVLGQITFEDNLQNQVYLKRAEEEETRRRRDTEERKVFPSDNGQNEPTSLQEFETVKVDGVYNTFVETVENHTSLNVSSLRHYAAHSISIWACREVDPEEIMNKTAPPSNCSLKSIIRTRTIKLEGADNLLQRAFLVRVQQSNQSLGVVRVEWQEPVSPNGLIITYQIQYKRVDIENHIPTTECITRQQFLKLDKSYTIKFLNAGNYSIRVMATSLAGNGNYTDYKYFIIEDTGGLSSQALIGSVAGVLISAFILSIVAYIVHRKCMPPLPPPQTKLIASVNPEYVSAVYVPDEWEMPRDNVQLIRELGQGSFGMVYEGFAKEIPKTGLKEVRCAVKTVNEHSTDRERIEFLNEASVMKAFDTAHVVRLLGVVSSGQPTLVVMELMANGDLKSYLRSHRPDAERPRNGQPPTLARFMQMAMEIADGMAYLSAKKFVHRDLAARNCMVADDLTVKVGDFGMTRDIYETDYYRKGSKGLLPVRWMSPESLKDGVFTSASDVWSYGVVLWEMATLASQPYQGLHNDQVLRYVIDGGVMERQENCPDKLFQLMQMTWQRQPGLRPTFLKLVSLLIGDSPSATFRENSFFFTPQARELLHQTQPSSGVADEAGPSASPARPEAFWKRNLASLDSDSDTPLTPDTSPTRSPSEAAAALPSSAASRSVYRDIFSQPFFGDRGRAEPHEIEALVSGGSPAPTAAGVKSSSPPRAVQPPQQLQQMQPTPNGFVPRSANGNPSSLAAASSRC